MATITCENYYREIVSDSLYEVSVSKNPAFITKPIYFRCNLTGSATIKFKFYDSGIISDLTARYYLQYVNESTGVINDYSIITGVIVKNICVNVPIPISSEIMQIEIIGGVGTIHIS